MKRMGAGGGRRQDAGVGPHIAITWQQIGLLLFCQFLNGIQDLVRFVPLSVSTKTTPAGPTDAGAPLIRWRSPGVNRPESAAAEREIANFRFGFHDSTRSKIGNFRFPKIACICSEGLPCMDDGNVIISFSAWLSRPQSKIRERKGYRKVAKNKTGLVAENPEF